MKKNRSFIFAAIFFIVFLGILVCVRCVDVKAIGPAGTKIGCATLNSAVRDCFSLNLSLKKVTDICGYGALSLVAVFAVLGLYRLVKEKSLKKVEPELYCLAGLYVALGFVYVLFEKVVINRRPVLLEDDIFPEASFPSSHTMLAIAIYGSTALMLKLYINNRSVCVALQILATVLAVITVVGRMICGVHWFTDIAAGACIALSMLFTFAGAQKCVRNKVTERQDRK